MTIFVYYTTTPPPPSVLSLHLLDLNPHLYADDTQLFFSFCPCDFDSSLTRLKVLMNIISSWMTANHLTINSSKTEFLLIEFKQQLINLNCCDPKACPLPS